MSTFAELKASLARRLGDPDAQTFEDADLGDMINEGISEVSRIAPQPFIEDITVIEGRTRYKLRGGNANLVPNSSFEEGDDTILVTGPVTVLSDEAESLLQGWSLLTDTPVWFPKASTRISGLRIGSMRPDVGQSDATMYVDIPVNPDTTYQFEGYHWKGLTGGLPARLELESRDEDNDLIESLWTHDTTASLPVLASTAYTTPDDGTVVYVRVKLICLGVQPSTRQTFNFEDISFAEASQAVLVAPNAVADIEVSRVEVWTVEDGVPKPLLEVDRPGTLRGHSSETGWGVWGGTLEIPTRWTNSITDTSFIRVWGYAPYDALTDDAQVTDLTQALEWAVLAYCDQLGLRRLLNDRNLYTQWQTHASNTDVSPATIANRLIAAEQAWERRSRKIASLRA